MKINKRKLEIKPLKEYIKKLENEMYASNNYDSKRVKNEITKLMIKLSICDVLIILFMFILYGLNICMLTITIFAIYLVNKIIIDKKFDSDKNKVLEELPDFIDELKSSYYEKRMVDEALLNAIANSPYEISQKAEKMHNALSSPNSKTEVEKYNRECNNRFLKTLMNILHITKEYGDKNYEDSIESEDSKFNINNSIFIKNLNFLLEEVNIEIIKHKLFKSKFQGLLVVTLFPLIFVNLIEIWSVSNFEQLSVFYNSFAGFILKNLSVLICIFMSILIVKIKNSQLNVDINKNKFNVNKDKNPQMMKMKKIINKLLPNKNSKQYNTVLKKLENSNILISPEKYYSNKIKYFLCSLIFMFAMFLSGNNRLEIVSNKTIFIEVIVILIVSLLSTFICDFNISFEKQMRKADKENEINSFRTMILILIHYSFTSCEKILNYLESYSVIYKNNIRRCINDFESNSEYALSVFENEVEEKGMKKILRCLKQCVKNIKVSQAFAFLETERNFYKEQTKYNNEKVVEEQTNLAKLISVIPYYTLIFLYFIVPMVYTGLNELTGLLNQIKTM